MGIIGHNGAGKSTLLRLLSGLGRPSSGSIRVEGNIGTLLELGNGFNAEMTGRENLLTGGILSGLTKNEVREVEEEIISFAELEQFIDQPVRTYSSGMYMRLAFATAMHFKPDILMIDEVLAVGDARFRKKCIDKASQFRSHDQSVVLVAHDMDQIKLLCDVVLVLEKGEVATIADPETAIQCYYDLMRQRTEKRTSMLSPELLVSASADNASRIGTQEAVVEGMTFNSGAKDLPTSIESGSTLLIDISTR